MTSLLLITSSPSLYSVTLGRVGNPNHRPMSNVTELAPVTVSTKGSLLCLWERIRLERETPDKCSHMLSIEQRKLIRAKSSECPVSGVPM